jgi:hypothetical protein
MERAAAFGEISEVTVFLDYFKDLSNPRQRGKVVYPLDELLLHRRLDSICRRDYWMPRFRGA